MYLVCESLRIGNLLFPRLLRIKACTAMFVFPSAKITILADTAKTFVPLLSD